MCASPSSLPRGLRRSDYLGHFIEKNLARSNSPRTHEIFSSVRIIRASTVVWCHAYTSICTHCNFLSPNQIVELLVVCSNCSRCACIGLWPAGMAAMMEQLRCELGCDCPLAPSRPTVLSRGLLPTGTGCGVHVDLLSAHTDAVCQVTFLIN